MRNGLSSDKFRFALVGAGIIGTHHSKVISELDDRDDPVVLMRFAGRWTSRRSRVMRLMIIVQGRWVSLAGERVLL